MRTEATVDIDAPIDLVFEWTNGDVSKWSTVVISEEILHRTDDVVGSRLRSVCLSGQKEMTFEGEVIAYDAPTFSAIHLVGDQFSMNVAYRFETTDRGTRVTQVSEVTPSHWMMRLVFGFLRSAIQKQSCEAAQQELQNLKAYCEYKRDHV